MTERKLAAAGAALIAAVALAGIGGAWAFATPSLSSLPKGPVLARAIERGKLVVGVRRYPRPAPPEAPTPPEPDGFDATLARQVAQSLGVPLELVGLDAAAQEAALREGRIDLLVAGVPAQTAQDIAAAPGSYDIGRGLVVALRRGKVQAASALRGATVCVGEGSGYAGAVSQRYGAEPRSYPSSVHAASAFMAGECAALAEDGEVLERLMQNEEWRFYKPLASDLRPPADAAIRLPEGDSVSRDYLAAALRQWRADGTLSKARGARAGNLQFEITLLKDGFVCHS
ncbi:substrate-binding periplasmic protein [Variovorax sp. IB41]|uniref:substrate-binding periplasmic protein n=1 Tax=Variovorax sp. IB41 TaxID=2779370 RepID=UPI0018E8B59F|nr:transporter substrate-binding domain-containing protein [Variovorax sp. IB41]MBJ2154413.1 transporter substrate-binding domain-containing protein [Variovorax sp. IB41]